MGVMERELFRKAAKTITELADELNAVRWAAWYAVDAWRNKKSWGIGFGGPETHETDVMISLVKEGRTREAERWTHQMNSKITIVKEIEVALGKES